MSDRPIEILLVEDNPDDEQLTLVALRDNHLANKVHVVRDGAEAIELLSCSGRYAHHTPASHVPRLILLDIKLPKIGGIEVLKFIKTSAELKLVPVVMLTSSREERDLLESYELGANSYITKPVTFEQFSEAMRQIGLYWLLLNELPSTPLRSVGPESP